MTLKDIFIAVLIIALTIKTEAQTFRNRLLPTHKEYGFYMGDYWVWGCSVIKGEDGKYHMFVSRWTKKINFNHWLTNSEIAHCISEKPEGPYTFSDVALAPRGEEYWDGKMTHNPAIRKHGDTYLLFYTGTTYKGDMPDEDHQITPESPKKLDAHQHERIGLATSKSPYGPYKRISDKPLDVGVGAEDPNMWYENGKFHALMLDHDRKYSNKEIYYTTSNDGLKWEIEPDPVAVTKDVLFQDGTRRMKSTERPWVLVEDGTATFVFFATGADIDGKRHTWNMCIPLKKIE